LNSFHGDTEIFGTRIVMAVNKKEEDEEENEYSDEYEDDD
jgi:hypothetical protein